ncbi:MAG: hypothetical protein ACRDKS_09730, partial [Actinomycetota bacterium]
MTDDAQHDLSARGLEVIPNPVEAATAERRRDWLKIAGKLASFAIALFLFILAIQLMKSGATAVGPSIEGRFPFANGVST